MKQLIQNGVKSEIIYKGNLSKNLREPLKLKLHI